MKKENKRDFSYYEFKVGQGREGYKPVTDKLVWNVLYYDINGRKIVPCNLFEINWIFLEEGLLYAKEHYSDDFEKFSEHIRRWLQHEYWSRCEYEVVVSKWGSNLINQEDLNMLQEKLNNEKKRLELNEYKWEPSIDIGYPDVSEKIDIYIQVMMNWDRFIEYVWNNKQLITKKKLGL